MIKPTEQEFLKLTKKGNLIPVCKEILGDLQTPVSAYFQLAKKSKYSFLLESVEGEEKVARFSFLARDPELILETKNNRLSVTRIKNNKTVKKTGKVGESPLVAIRKIMQSYKFVPMAGLPPFCGGMVGFLSYDVVRFFERIPSKTKDDLRLPDTLFVLAKDLIIFDHLSHKIKIVSCVEINPKDTKATKTKAYKAALKKVDQLAKELSEPLLIHRTQKKRNKTAARLKSNVTKAQFKKMVATAKEHIRAGDIIQVVLSQRFETKLDVHPFDVYRSLRSLNPSPYMYYLSFNGVHIVGSSPELLVRCENGVVETRPIAGTRPRGKNTQEDERLAKDLLADPKERAEHIMLVDLGRNDLGRICQKGSVRLSEFMAIEKYSHVMHIISNVKGTLKRENDDLDVLQSCFPAGTVSGAPKIRAMEIIEDLERVCRGPYAGCIGYFSFSGNLDTCITIRTIVAKKGKAYIQAGAGIVADSNPDREYQETKNKARAQLMAIEMANRA